MKIKTDSVKKIITFALIALLVVLMSNSLSISAATKKPWYEKKVNELSIRLADWNSHTNKYTFKWGKIKKVDGYQVRIIDRDLYDYDDIVRVYDRGTTYKNKGKIKMELSIDHSDVSFIKIQVRPYKIKMDGTNKYGKWSTSAGDYALFYRLN